MGTGRAGELKLGNVRLGRNNSSARSGRANVDHEDFAFGELRHLGLLAIWGLDAEKTSEQEQVDVQVGVNVGQTTLQSEDVTDQSIGTAKRRINASADA